MKINSAAAPVLGRMLRPMADGLRSEVLQAITTIQSSAADAERYHHLADGNAEGTLTPQEHQELESFVMANTVLSLLRKEAKATLAQRA
jgi:hypothetical protein